MTANRVQRACPVCSASGGNPLLSKGDLVLLRCARCGMVFASPVPESLLSGEYYDDASSYYLSPEKLRADYAPSRFQREIRLFQKHCHSGRVLDVGCSSGGFLFNLQRVAGGAYEILGTDVSGEPLNYAEGQGIPVFRGSFLTAELPPASFDAITFWAVLEHLDKPAAFVSRAFDLLKPGGLLFVLVPNFRSLATRLLRERYRYIQEQHINYFERATLLRLLERFEIVEVRTTHFNPVVIVQDWRRGGAEVSHAERAALLNRTTTLKQSPWLLPARAVYGASEFVLGSMGLADNLAVVARKAEFGSGASGEGAKRSSSVS